MVPHSLCSCWRVVLVISHGGEEAAWWNSWATAEPLVRGLVVGCWLLMVGCWLLVVGCWWLVVGCWLLMVGCWLLVVDGWLLVVDGWLLVVGCWWLVVGCWLLRVGCYGWLLVVDGWLLVVDGRLLVVDGSLLVVDGWFLVVDGWLLMVGCWLVFVVVVVVVGLGDVVVCAGGLLLFCCSGGGAVLLIGGPSRPSIVGPDCQRGMFQIGFTCQVFDLAHLRHFLLFLAPGKTCSFLSCKIWLHAARRGEEGGRAPVAPGVNFGLLCLSFWLALGVFCWCIPEGNELPRIFAWCLHCRVKSSSYLFRVPTVPRPHGQGVDLGHKCCTTLGINHDRAHGVHFGHKTGSLRDT